MISHLIILGIIVTFSIGVDYAFAESTEPIITVQMKGSSTYYLDSPNQIIRATVEIQNYSPSDGIYFMKVIHLPTEKVMRDFDIYPKPSGNDLWSVQIAYPFLESDVKIGGQTFFGEFEIQIRTEFGSQTASTTFSIFEFQDQPETEPTTESTTEPSTEPSTEPIVEPESQTPIDPPFLEPDTEPSEQSTQKIPGWVKRTMGWFADGLISEDELISAIKFLIEEGIIKLD